MASFDYRGFPHDGPIWLLKIDCEGCEYKALRGAARLLADPVRAPSGIFLELTPGLRYFPFLLICFLFFSCSLVGLQRC